MTLILEEELHLANRIRAGLCWAVLPSPSPLCLGVACYGCSKCGLPGSSKGGRGAHKISDLLACPSPTVTGCDVYSGFVVQREKPPEIFRLFFKICFVWERDLLPFDEVCLITGK